METMEKSRVINMTPHIITVYSGDEVSHTYPPCGEILKSHTYPPSGETLRMNLLPIIESGLITTYRLDETCMPPDELDNVVYIASLPYLMALHAMGIERDDIVAPDTNAKGVRNEKGVIIGVRGFLRLHA